MYAVRQTTRYPLPLLVSSQVQQSRLSVSLDSTLPAIFSTFTVDAENLI
jgi:hypothetical protein